MRPGRISASSAQLVPGDSAAAAELGRELAVLIDGV